MKTKKIKEKAKGYWSKMFRKIKKVFRKKRKEKKQSERTTERTPTPIIRTEQPRTYTPITYTPKQTRTTQQEQPKQTQQASDNKALSQTKNINSLLTYADKGRQIVSFDADDGKHLFQLKNDHIHQLAKNIQLIYSEGVVTIQTNQGKALKKTPITIGKTSLIASSIMA